MNWKWTKGEPYERSRRIANNAIPTENNINENDKSMEELAYSSSLHHDENTWEILNQSFNGFRNVNKRADTDQRLSERQMTAQVNMNPYLVNNNYVDDIETHSQFLKPKSTNLDREKGNPVSE
jgi:hypothetical protein